MIQEQSVHSSVAFEMNTSAHVSPGMQKQAANQFDDGVISKGLVVLNRLQTKLNEYNFKEIDDWLP